MANVTINNTFKANWIQIKMNNYYPTTTDESEHLLPITGVLGICMKESNGNLVVELHMRHEEFVLFLTKDYPNSGYVVDTINGVAVADDADLKTKLLALL
jgi:hypothetical protein